MFMYIDILSIWELPLHMKVASPFPDARQIHKKTQFATNDLRRGLLCSPT